LSARLHTEVCGEAANGEEAIAKAKELQPDLIILDVTMPVLSGFDAAREMEKYRRRSRFMHESKQLLEEAKRIGVKGYVTKTQAGETLLRAVDALLSKQVFYPEPA
jgi:DNA-binding NarL/FixJ family response regulator